MKTTHLWLPKENKKWPRKTLTISEAAKKGTRAKAAVSSIVHVVKPICRPLAANTQAAGSGAD